MLADKLNILPRNIHVSHGSLLSVHVHCKLVDTTDMSTSQSLDGIRASPSEKGNGNTITLLNKDNYSAWSCKVEGALIASDLWDVVSGERKAPIVPAAIRNADDTATVNEGSITTKTAELKAFQKESKQAASYLLNIISDNQLFHVKPIRTDPVAM